MVVQLYLSCKLMDNKSVNNERREVPKEVVGFYLRVHLVYELIFLKCSPHFIIISTPFLIKAGTATKQGFI